MFLVQIIRMRLNNYSKEINSLYTFYNSGDSQNFGATTWNIFLYIGFTVVLVLKRTVVKKPAFKTDLCFVYF